MPFLLVPHVEHTAQSTAHVPQCTHTFFGMIVYHRVTTVMRENILRSALTVRSQLRDESSIAPALLPVFFAIRLPVHLLPYPMKDTFVCPISVALSA